MRGLEGLEGLEGMGCMADGDGVINPSYLKSVHAVDTCTCTFNKVLTPTARGIFFTLMLDFPHSQTKHHDNVAKFLKIVTLYRDYL